MFDKSLNVELPKWPGLLVSNQKVTKEQAMEIIIRTDDCISYHSSNDHDWVKQIMKFVGISQHDSKNAWMGFNHEETNKVLKQIKHVLTLMNDDHYFEYLYNSQVMSCYVGGPHGWIDWDGNVGCSSYNIGKWPSCKDVYNEWEVITKAFPFLDIQCQLLSDEIDSDDPSEPLIQFNIKNGTVEMVKPVERLVVNSPNWRDKPFSTYMNERGCTFEQFVEAFNFVKEKI